jgi:hypothetical protein
VHHIIGAKSSRATTLDAPAPAKTALPAVVRVLVDEGSEGQRGEDEAAAGEGGAGEGAAGEGGAGEGGVGGLESDSAISAFKQVARPLTK